MNKKCFQSKKFAPSKLYSPAVTAGGLVYFSGMGPTDPATGQIVSQDFENQMRQTINNLTLLLEEMGLSLSNVVKTNIYLSDIGNFSKANEIYSEYFSRELPARTTIQVAGLPNGIQIEIELIAAKNNNDYE